VCSIQKTVESEVRCLYVQDQVDCEQKRRKYSHRTTGFGETHFEKMLDRRKINRASPTKSG